MAQKNTPDHEYNVIFKTYFAGHEDVLGFDGVDGISEHWENDSLTRVLFPKKFAASSASFDASLVFHEMGHFVTLNPLRIVRYGFGFGSGIPLLTWNPYERMQVKAVSNVVEAKAFAWEMLLLKRYFGIEPDVEGTVKSLVYASDFPSYPGNSKEEKLAAVAELTRKYMAEYAAADNFDQLWESRVAMLPELMHRETTRRYLLQETPAPEVTETVGGFSFSLLRHADENIEAWSVLITDDGETMVVQETFDTRKAAEKWMKDVVESVPVPDSALAM